MGLFDRHAGLLEAYRDVRTTGLDPFQIRMERVLSPTQAIINGKPTLLVGTNNYFGLTFDPSCMEAAIEAIRNEGTGTTGSPSPPRHPNQPRGPPAAGWAVLPNRGVGGPAAAAVISYAVAALWILRPFLAGRAAVRLHWPAHGFHWCALARPPKGG